MSSAAETQERKYWIWAVVGVVALGIFSPFIFGTGEISTALSYFIAVIFFCFIGTLFAGREYYRWSIAVGALLAGLMLFIVFYQLEAYVYACRDDGTSRCYQLKAERTENAYSRIYFRNGGYISFDYCEKTGKRHTCYPEDRTEDLWLIDFSHEEFVRRW